MTGILISPDFDFPGESDSREFVSQNKSACASIGPGSAPMVFDNERSMPDRGTHILGKLGEVPERSLDWIGTCSHGTGRSVQCGFDERGPHKPGDLALAMARLAKVGQTFTVPLWSCSTAADEKGGFAAQLYRALVALGVDARVFGHTTVGHCTRNPYVRVWDSKRNGEWLIAPSSEDWRRWVNALHAPGSTLPYRFPWLSRMELLDELRK